LACSWPIPDTFFDIIEILTIWPRRRRDGSREVGCGERFLNSFRRDLANGAASPLDDKCFALLGNAEQNLGEHSCCLGSGNPGFHKIILLIEFG
jgi:hypothetical protein